MRRYLATLHKRSDSHKKNFALLVSGGFTLAIFAVWLFVNYGSLGSPQVAEDTAGVTQLAAVHEVGPFQSLADSLSSSWSDFVGSVKNLTEAVHAPDVKQGYDQMKSETFDTYGR